MRTVDDLVTWLRAQLDDDERLIGEYEHYMGERGAAASSFVLVIPPGWRPGEPFAPARVLAEVDAKRRILDAHTTAASAEDSEYDGGFTAGLLTALRFLALPYADRPGYREDWRP